MTERTNLWRNPKPTFSPLSYSDRKAIIPASCKSVLLHDWWLVKSEDKGIAVAGFASRDERKMNYLYVCKRSIWFPLWHRRLGARVFTSARISRRLDATTLETLDGVTIKISGLINRSQSHQNGFSFMVCNSFQLGFPYCWEDCVSQCCGEESSKQSCTDAYTFLPFTLDNLPATRLRDHVMCLPEDSENLFCDVMGKLRDNASQHAPVTGNSNSANEGPSVTASSEMEETPRKHKKLKTDQMQRDDNDRTLEAKDTVTKFNRYKGVVTRSMSRSRNLRSKGEEDVPLSSPGNFRNSRNKLGKNLPSNFFIEGESSAQLSTSAAKESQSEGVVCALQAGSIYVSSRQDEKDAEFRRSGRLNKYCDE